MLAPIAECKNNTADAEAAAILRREKLPSKVHGNYRIKIINQLRGCQIITGHHPHRYGINPITQGHDVLTGIH